MGARGGDRGVKISISNFSYSKVIDIKRNLPDIGISLTLLKSCPKLRKTWSKAIFNLPSFLDFEPT
jgi:hypothetical protein